jgi:hypothetical protein
MSQKARLQSTAFLTLENGVRQEACIGLRAGQKLPENRLAPCSYLVGEAAVTSPQF